MSTRQDVYAEIDRERAYQDHVWGRTASSGRPGTGDRTIDEFILYVFGRSVELSALASHSDKADEKLDHMRKIAALCVACLEQHGCPPRRMPNDPNHNIFPASTPAPVFANPTDALASRRSDEKTLHPQGVMTEAERTAIEAVQTAKFPDRCGVFIAQDETCRNPEPCPEHPFKSKMLWRGRAIERLSKEELIEVAVELASQVEDERLQHKSDLSVIDAEVVG